MSIGRTHGQNCIKYFSSIVYNINIIELIIKATHCPNIANLLALGNYFQRLWRERN